MKNERINIKKWQKLAGIIKENMDGTSVGGDSIHILNDQNAIVQQKDINGFPYKYLQLNLQQDLSETDIDKLIAELKTFKEKLVGMNTPQKPQ